MRVFHSNRSPAISDIDSDCRPFCNPFSASWLPPVNRFPQVYGRVVRLVDLDINGAARAVVDADVQRRVDHVAHVHRHGTVGGDVERDMHCNEKGYSDQAKNCWKIHNIPLHSSHTQYRFTRDSQFLRLWSVPGPLFPPDFQLVPFLHKLTLIKTKIGRLLL